MLAKVVFASLCAHFAFFAVRFFGFTAKKAKNAQRKRKGMQV